MQGILVIQKATNTVIAILENRFNPDNHEKIAGPMGDPWPAQNPPPIPSIDAVEAAKAPKAAKKAEAASEEAPAPKKKPVKKGKK